MNEKTKRLLSFVLIAVGAAAVIFALVLCFQAFPLRTRDIKGILKVRGAFLFLGLVVIAAGVYVYPTIVHHRSIINVLFSLPMLIPFVMAAIFPLLLGIFYSLTDWDGNKFTKFVGLANYMDFFKAPDYINALVMTVIFALINVTLVNIAAFFMALLVTQKLKGSNVYRAGFFVPNLIGGIVLGYVWQFIFNYVFVNLAKGMGMADAQSMLNIPWQAIAALVIVSVWQSAGYTMMIYVTALQGISTSVLEAAKIDGASGWKRMTSIIMPMIAHAFTICIFLTLTGSFKQFDVNLSLTNGGPSRIIVGKAIMSTELQALNIYKTAITRNQWALAQAKSVVFFIVLAAVSMAQVYVNKKREEEA